MKKTKKMALWQAACLLLAYLVARYGLFSLHGMKQWPTILLALGIGLGIGLYDGIVGPGTGTFAIIAFTTLMGFDLRTANGNGKVLNLASNYASLFTYLMNGLVVFHIGIPCAISNILGNLLGSHFALKKGARFIRPMMLVVLVLLLGKLISDAVL